MARLYHGGAEVEAGSVATGPDGLVSGTTVTRDTSIFRSGLAAWKFDSGAGNGIPTVIGPVAAAASKTLYVRAYFYATAAPSTAAEILGTNSTTDPLVRFRTDGAIELLVNGSAVGSASASSIADSTWHRVEMKVVISAGDNYTDAEVLLDGTTVATWSGTQGRAGGNFRWGWSQQPGANKIIYADDVAINDSTGAANNSYPGSGNVILMAPISDNARGAFTAGAGGTTNLWDAVNNTPPVGVAEASATNTSQIKNRTTTNTTNCDLNLDTYANAGVGASDTVNAIICYAAHGEDPGTGTKAGSVSMVSNPAIGAATFNFGDDVGAQGTYLGNWKWKATAASDAPSVTIASAPVIRITCTSGATGSRSASCCFLGAYVDYTPTAASSLIWQSSAPTRMRL